MLIPKQKALIKKLSKPSLNQSQIAKKVGCSPATVCIIQREPIKRYCRIIKKLKRIVMEERAKVIDWRKEYLKEEKRADKWRENFIALAITFIFTIFVINYFL